MSEETVCCRCGTDREAQFAALDIEDLETQIAVRKAGEIRNTEEKTQVLSDGMSSGHVFWRNKLQKEDSSLLRQWLNRLRRE